MLLLNGLFVELAPQNMKLSTNPFFTLHFYGNPHLSPYKKVSSLALDILPETTILLQRLSSRASSLTE